MSRQVRLFAFGSMILLTSLLTSVAACEPIRSVGPQPRVPFRPPSWIFGVVWPILYVTTGVAWYRAYPSFDRQFWGVTGLCCAWLVLFTCLVWKRVAALVLLLSAAVTWWLCASLAWSEGAYLVPLAGWLLFAAYLNVAGLVLEA